MEITFLKNQSVRDLDEQTFLMTKDYQDKKLGVGNVSIFKDVVDAISKSGFQYEVQDIYIQKRAITKPSIREIEREKYLSEWDPKGVILDKYIARIGYKNDKISNQYYSPSIAISFDNNHIEVAQGLNVHVCSNMNILSADRHVRSWGEGKMSWDDMLKKVFEWMSDAVLNFAMDIDKVSILTNIEVGDPYAVLEQIAGLLHVEVERDLFFKRNNQVLNHGITNEFIRKMIKLIEEQDKVAGYVSAYDFYQEMTDASSHQAEISQRIVSTWRVYEFIEKYFAVDEVMDGKRYKEIANSVGKAAAMSEEAEVVKDIPQAPEPMEQVGDVPDGPNLGNEATKAYPKEGDWIKEQESKLKINYQGDGNLEPFREVNNKEEENDLDIDIRI